MKVADALVGFLIHGVEPTPPKPIPPPTPAPAMGVLSAAGLVILTFIFVSILLLRDRDVMSKKTGGAVTLTLASIILLSGVWCYALSPTATRYDHVSIVGGEEPTIEPYQMLTYYVDLKAGERITGDIGYELALFTLRIYDPDGSPLRPAMNVSHISPAFEALETGRYRIEIENPNPESITPYVYIGKESEVPYRRLAPTGQWLSLISVPLFALGLWAYLGALKRKKGRVS